MVDIPLSKLSALTSRGEAKPCVTDQQHGMTKLCPRQPIKQNLVPSVEVVKDSCHIGYRQINMIPESDKLTKSVSLNDTYISQQFRTML
jgi:hypothetical protein